MGNDNGNSLPSSKMNQVHKQFNEVNSTRQGASFKPQTPEDKLLQHNDEESMKCLEHLARLLEYKKKLETRQKEMGFNSIN